MFEIKPRPQGASSGIYKSNECQHAEPSECVVVINFFEIVNFSCNCTLSIYFKRLNRKINGCRKTAGVCTCLCPGDLGDNPLDINTFLICHSYFQQRPGVTGFLYPCLKSLAGFCHPATEALNRVIWKMESLTLTADDESKIEGY